jgi:hypothetical protein
VQPRALPADQALPAACPACGLVLAKFAAISRGPTRTSAPAHATAHAVEAQAPHEPDEAGFLKTWLLYVPREVAKPYWAARVATLIVFAIWTWLIWADTDIPAGEIGSRFLHLVLTPFHEAGHYLIFRWFGRFIMTLGGTLGQHLMPMVLGVALLWKRRDPFGAAVFFWLLGFSVIDMGVYMYDAFDPKLMLITGKTGAEDDGHDWQNIFGDLGLLRHARGIGLFFGVVGKAMMIAALAWAVWLLALQYRRLSDSVFAEEDELNLK